MSEYDSLKKSKLKFKTGTKKPKTLKSKRPKIKEESTSKDDLKDAGYEDAQDHGGWWKIGRFDQIKGDIVVEFLPGCYAKAMSNGAIVLGNPHPPGEGPEEEEIFTVVSAGNNQIALKSGFDRYWNVDSRKRIMGLSEAIGPPETFLPVFEDNNTALCAFNDLFLSPDLSMETNQPLLANAEKAGPQEMITIRVNHNPSLLDGKHNKQDQQDSGKIYDAELSHLKKYQSHGSRHFADDDRRDLKKARVEGQLYEALLDKRTKHKSDKFETLGEMAIQHADIASVLVELEKLSSDELKELCNSTSHDKYDEFVNQSEKIKGLETEREMLMASVKSLAEFNLAKQGDYESDRSKLLSFVGDSNKLKEDIQTKATKLLELSKRTSLESTLATVQAAASQADVESENYAKSFLDNTIDYDSFVTQYLDKRKLAHSRRIKAERLRKETNESWSGIRAQSFGPLSQ